MGLKKFPMGPIGFPMGGKGRSLPTWEFPWEGRGKEGPSHGREMSMSIQAIERGGYVTVY
jgi:hypothetical protein